MKRFLKFLFCPAGRCVISGERYYSFLIIGRFWFNWSLDRLHFSFEYLPF